jgi:hypothetical protein
MTSLKPACSMVESNAGNPGDELSTKVRFQRIAASVVGFDVRFAEGGFGLFCHYEYSIALYAIGCQADLA